MSAKRVDYHEGAIADVKTAVAWYRKRSPKAALDFIEELHRATDTIRNAPERWPLGKNNTRRFLLWRFPSAVIYSQEESVITIWGCRPWQQATGVLGASPLMGEAPTLRYPKASASVFGCAFSLRPYELNENLLNRLG